MVTAHNGVLTKTAAAKTDATTTAASGGTQEAPKQFGRCLNCEKLLKLGHDAKTFPALLRCNNCLQFRRRNIPSDETRKNQSGNPSSDSSEWEGLSNHSSERLVNPAPQSEPQSNIDTFSPSDTAGAEFVPPPRTARQAQGDANIEDATAEPVDGSETRARPRASEPIV